MMLARSLTVLIVLVGVAIPVQAQTAKVNGTFALPPNVPSFKGQVLEIMLWEYNPRLADASAKLVEKVEVKDFSHTKGKETKKKFVVGAKANTRPQRGYYITVFVTKDGKRTHIGFINGQPGLNKVLSNGRNKVNVIGRPVRR